MPPKRKSARQSGRSAAKITKRATPASRASSDLAEVSAAQQTAAHVNIEDLASVGTMAVTEALKAVGVGQMTPLASSTMVIPSPWSVDASATVETTTAAEIASILSMSMGMSISNSNDKSSEVNFTSVAIDLEAHVLAKLKAKIWANEYVDLGRYYRLFPMMKNLFSRLTTMTENRPVFASSHQNRSPSFYLWGNGRRPLTPLWLFIQLNTR